MRDESANAHAAGYATTAARDLAAFDALPPPLRRALRDLPENLAAEAVLQAIEEDGEDPAAILSRLARRCGPQETGSKGDAASRRRQTSRPSPAVASRSSIRQ